jgi:hypothetical protein
MNIFEEILQGIDNDALVHTLDHNDFIKTIASVGAVNLQCRLVLTKDEPGPEQEDYPSLWQSVGVEVAYAVYGDVICRDTEWGHWVWLGDKSERETMACLKATVIRLTDRLSHLAPHSCGQKIDRLSSAKNTLLNPQRAGITRLVHI